MTELLHHRDAYIEAFAGFVGDAPSSYHAASAVAEVLSRAGFEPHDEAEEWAPVAAGSRGVVVRDGAVIAWRAGGDAAASLGPATPVRILGAHTDSPGFVLKPQPSFAAEGWQQAGVEVYGGPMLNSWLDRDLGFAGRIVTGDGSEHLVRTGAVARIPQLAIHLDREVNAGLTLDRQRHTQPVLGVTVAVPDPVRSLLADAVRAEGHSIREDDIAGTDVRLFDTQPPARIGFAGELFASPRLDNLSSVFAGLAALLETEPAPGTIAMLAAFDHEELGSSSRSGAAGPFLEDVVSRIAAGLGAGVEDRARALAASWCLSADAGHAVHPNYPEKHDPRVRPRPGGGAMLKINANQRYASDAHGAGLWRRCCEAAGVPTQEFVSSNDTPCGSTIGPITATRLGIRTVDVGVPLLSMHSARELAHVDDLHGLGRATASFFAGA